MVPRINDSSLESNGSGDFLFYPAFLHPVGATRGRPRILQRKIRRRKAKENPIYENRKSVIFGGRPRAALTV